MCSWAASPNAEEVVEDEEQAIIEASGPERSIHEAGHVVVLLRYEYRVLNTTIIPTDEWAGHTEAPGLRFQQIYSLSNEEVRKHAQVACAAAAAVAISNDEADIDFDTATELFSGAYMTESEGSDWGLFRRCVEFLTRNDLDDPEKRSPFDKRSEEIWEETIKILQTHWTAAEAFSKALLENGRLEEDEIVEIWRAAGNE
jgi:ATP-dependent Zn protease